MQFGPCPHGNAVRNDPSRAPNCMRYELANVELECNCHWTMFDKEYYFFGAFGEDSAYNRSMKK